MGVSHLFLKPYPIIVCLILGITGITFGKNEVRPPDCIIDCSNFSTPEYYPCITDFPSIHPNFLDFTTNGNQDIATFQALGGIVSNCSNLIITAQDFNFPPNSCSDSLRVQRRYQISDGQTILQECTRTFVTFELPIRITQHAKNEIVSCDQNVDSLFQEWLDAYGYSDLFECQSPPSVTRLPETPVVFYGNCRTVDTLTNIISGEIRVQWDFVDDCGIKVSTIAGFFVIDSIGPSIDCPIDMTFDIGDDNLFEDIENTLNQVQGLEDCSEYKITNDFVNSSVLFNCDQEQTIPVVFTAIDSCQNSTNCNSSISIVNESNPIIMCPNNIFLECGDINNFDLVTDWINSTIAEDNIGNPLAISTDFALSILNSSFCNQETDITFEATDNCGRNTSCVSRIIIDDNLAPNVSCPPSFLSNFSSPSLQNDIQFWLSSFGATDLCNSFQANTDLIISDLAYDCQDLNMTVTYDATDECGNANSCQSNISITDDYTSQITCPGNLTLYCGDQDNFSNLSTWINSVQASDSFGSLIDITFNLDINDPSILECHNSTAITFTMIDLCGDIKECVQAFDVLDTLPPTIICPSAITIESDPLTLDADIQIWLSSHTAGDNCTSVSVENTFSSTQFEGCDLSINNDITFTAFDECGLQNTCVSNLTIETDRFPTVNCAPDLIIECGEPDNTRIISNWISNTTANDFANNILSVQNSYSPSDLPLLQCTAELEIAFFTIDNCNWTDTCRTSILLFDTEAPNITCPNNLSINSTSLDLSTQVNTWLNSAMTNDNCLGSDISHNADLNNFDFCNPAVNNGIVFTATDSCGLTSSCMSTITINNDDPSIICPQELTLECGDNNNANLIAAWLETSGAMNNNSDVLLTTNDLDVAVIQSGCIDTYPVVFTAEDSCLKSASCTSNIILNDTESPLIDCPIDLNLLAGDPNKESKYNDYLNNIETSDCNGFIVESDFDLNLLAFSCDDELVLPFTYTALDDCGNVSNCFLNIIVSNNIVADIQCPNNLNLNCGDPNNENLIIAWLEETVAEDNTGNSFPVDNNFDLNNPDLITCQSSITVEFEMVDLCSMAITCTSSINIVDNESPEIICPIDTSFVFEDPNFTVNINNWLNLAQGSDNCTAVTIQNNFDANTVLGNCEEETISLINFEVSDECGFTNSCAVNLTIQTSRVPTINCPQPLIFECGIDNNITIENWLSDTQGMDADGNNLISINDYNPSDFNLLTCGDTLSVIFSVSDNCNFNAECTSNIIIEDTTNPEVNCPTNLFVNSSDNNVLNSITAWLSSFSSTDNCGTVTTGNDFDDITFDVCSASESIPVTFNASDACGLTNTCESEIQINKSLPTINCPTNLVLECGTTMNLIDAEILSFIDEVQANDNSGNAITNINNDFVLGSILNACQLSQTITVSAMDNCNQQADCSFTFDLIDNTSPEIICPNAITIDIKSNNIQSQIDNWLDSASAIESCLSFNITDDYSLNLSTIDCSSFVEVEFMAEDDCGNISSCFSDINFVNNNNITISCPDPIQVQCSDFLTATIDSFLNDVNVISQDTFIITNDYTALPLNCLQLEIQDIVFEAEDICGNSNLCNSTITYIPDGKTYIPNTFSPNRDGNNDYFTVFSNDFITSIKSMQIFSRWGDLVFEKTDFAPNIEDEGWDGSFNGADAVIGVYVYQVEIEDNKGNIILETGSLQLIR